MKKVLAWPFLLALHACGGGARLSAPLARPADAPKAARPNSYAELVQLIQAGDGNGPLRSVDALLAKLAADAPESVEGFALVYASRSLQTATPDFPRVVLYGTAPADYKSDNRLVLAFSGDPSEPDYQTVEVMSQDPATAQIQLAEVTFPGTGTGEPRFAVDPPRCALCHGSPARPVWDSYPVWPGVYGSIDDLVDPGTSELADFRKFTPKLGQPGRYEHLAVQASDDTIYLGDRNQATVRLRNTPNLALTTTLSQMNYRRVAHAAMALPRFPALKFAFVGAANGCFDTLSDLGQWLPPAAVQAVGAKLADVQKLTSDDATANDADKARRFFNVHGLPASATAGEDLFGFDVSDAPRAGALRFAALLAGSDMRDWSMTLTPRAVSYATGGYGIMDFPGPLLDALANDPDHGTLAVGSGDCARLATASKAAVTPEVTRELAAAAPAVAADLASDGVDRQPVVLRCMSCHTTPLADASGNPPATPGATPYYPFDRISAFRALQATHGGLGGKLRAAVQAPATSPVRMPKAPRATLTATEKAAFLDFVDNLTEPSWH